MSNAIDKAIEQAKRDFDNAGGMEALVTDVLNLSKEVEEYDPEDLTEYGEDEPTIDIRLGYEPTWTERLSVPTVDLMTGDSSYDQYHYTACGASCVGAKMTHDEARAVAEDLLDQMLEAVASAAHVLPEDWDPDAEEGDEEE